MLLLPRLHADGRLGFRRYFLVQDREHLDVYQIKISQLIDKLYVKAFQVFKIKARGDFLYHRGLDCFASTKRRRKKLPI